MTGTDASSPGPARRVVEPEFTVVVEVPAVLEAVLEPEAPVEDEEIAAAKDELRHAVGARRRQRDVRALAAAADGITRQATDLLATLGLTAGASVAAYVSRRDEPGTHPMLTMLHEADIEVLLPVLGPALDRRWGTFSGLDTLAQRAPGRPLEPANAECGPEVLARASLVLVPALAVDPDGYRLGRGGGWYDRALRYAAPGALVVAIVYDEDVRDAPLPREPHDVPVGAVLTPARWWRLGTPPAR